MPGLFYSPFQNLPLSILHLEVPRVNPALTPCHQTPRQGKRVGKGGAPKLLVSISRKRSFYSSPSSTTANRDEGNHVTSGGDQRRGAGKLSMPISHNRSFLRIACLKLFVPEQQRALNKSKQAMTIY